MASSSAKVHPPSVQSQGDNEYRPQVDADVGGPVCGAQMVDGRAQPCGSGPVPVFSACARACATCREDGPCCRDPASVDAKGIGGQRERDALWGEKDGMRLGDTVGINQKNYLDKTCFKVALRELYEVDASLYDNQDFDYCPVLLRRGPAAARELPGGWLMQLWRRGGELVYEYGCATPIARMCVSQLTRGAVDAVNPGRTGRKGQSSQAASGEPSGTAIFVFIEDKAPPKGAAARREHAHATLHAVLLEPGEAPVPYTFDLGPPANLLGYRGGLEDIPYLGMCDGTLVLASEREVHYYDLWRLLAKCRDAPGAAEEGANSAAGSAGVAAAQTRAAVDWAQRELAASKKTASNGGGLASVAGGLAGKAAAVAQGLRFRTFRMRDAEAVAVATDKQRQAPAGGAAGAGARGQRDERLRLQVRGVETMGGGVACLILEEMDFHYLVFMKLTIDAGSDGANFRLTLIGSKAEGGERQRNDPIRTNPPRGLGAPQSQGGTEAARVRVPAYVQHVVQRQRDEHNPEQGNMHFAVALRAHGALDFYCNFICVSTFDRTNELDARGEPKPAERVTRVEMDFQRIYFETTTDAVEQKAGGADGKKAFKQLWVCDLSNSRLVGSDTCRLKTTEHASASDERHMRDTHERLLDEAAERRIAEHFRLFSHFVCNKTAFYVAHRNWVSEYTLEAAGWGAHVAFRDTVTDLALLQPRRGAQAGTGPLGARVYCEYAPGQGGAGEDATGTDAYARHRDAKALAKESRRRDRGLESAKGLGQADKPLHALADEGYARRGQQNQKAGILPEEDEGAASAGDSDEDASDSDLEDAGAKAVGRPRARTAAQGRGGARQGDGAPPEEQLLVVEGHSHLVRLPCGGADNGRAAVALPRTPVFPVVKLIGDGAGSAAGRGRVLMLMRRPQSCAEYEALHGGGAGEASLDQPETNYHNRLAAARVMARGPQAGDAGEEGLARGEAGAGLQDAGALQYARENDYVDVDSAQHRTHVYRGRPRGGRGAQIGTVSAFQGSDPAHGEDPERRPLWLGAADGSARAGEAVADVALKARMLEGACQLVLYDGEKFMRVAHPDLDRTLDSRSSVAYSTPPLRAAAGVAATGSAGGATCAARRRRSLQLAIGPGPTGTGSEGRAGQRDATLTGAGGINQMKQRSLSPGIERIPEEQKKEISAEEEQAAAATKVYLVEGVSRFLKTAWGPAHQLDLPAPITLGGAAEEEATGGSGSNADGGEPGAEPRLLSTYTVPAEEQSAATAARAGAEGGPASAAAAPGYLVEIRTDRINIYAAALEDEGPAGVPAWRRGAHDAELARLTADAARARAAARGHAGAAGAGVGAGAESAVARFGRQHAYRRATPLFTLTGLRIRAVQFQDQRYLYALQDATRGQVSAPGRAAGAAGQEDPCDADSRFRAAGVFIYDLQDILRTRNVQRIKLSDALSCAYDQLNYHPANDRISFIQSGGRLMFMPLVHRNTLKFIGMGRKDAYLAWLECEGEFTALDTGGELHTWSAVTGMKLCGGAGGAGAGAGAAGRAKAAFREGAGAGAAARVAALAGYELYRQGAGDTTYLEGDYNMLAAPARGGAAGAAAGTDPWATDCCSYSLLVERPAARAGGPGGAGAVSSALAGDAAQDEELDAEAGPPMDGWFTEAGGQRGADGALAAQGGARAAGGAGKPAHVEVRESSQRVVARSFKVMRLRADRAAVHAGVPAPCRYSAEEHFNFRFQVYRDDEPAFDYSKPGYPAQSLYLSADTTKLLEIVFEKGMAQVWRREGEDTDAALEARRRAPGGRGAPTIRWRPYRVVPAYPQLMDSLSTKNTLFDPNFRWMLNVCFLTNEFFLWDVQREERCDARRGTEPEAAKLLASVRGKGAGAKAATKIRGEDVPPARRLPRDFLRPAPSQSEEVSKATIVRMAARIQLLADGKLRVLNHDACDCIIDPTKWARDPNDPDAPLELGEDGVLSCVKVDNLPDAGAAAHHFLEPLEYAAEETTARLIRTSQKWKSWLEHAPHLYAAKGLPVTPRTIFEAMYCVDYSERWDGDTSAFKSQQSFTMYDWILSDKIIKGSNVEFSIRKMAPSVRCRLAFNVFPGGETVLHKLARAIKAGSSAGNGGGEAGTAGRQEPACTRRLAAAWREDVENRPRIAARLPRRERQPREPRREDSGGARAGEHPAHRYAPAAAEGAVCRQAAPRAEKEREAAEAAQKNPDAGAGKGDPVRREAWAPACSGEYVTCGTCGLTLCTDCRDAEAKATSLAREELKHAGALATAEAAGGRQAASNQHMTRIVDGIFAALRGCEDASLQGHYAWWASRARAEEPRLEMPITRDIRGESGLDVVLGHTPHRARLPRGLYMGPTTPRRGGPAAAEGQGQCLSAAFAGKIFAAIAPYGYMHSGAVVAGAIPGAVEADVPGIFDYLGARLRVPAHAPPAMQPGLLDAVRQVGTDKSGAPAAYAAVAFAPWAGHGAVCARFFKAEAAGAKPLQSYRLAYYDIPWLHEDGPEGRALMTALAAPELRERAALDGAAVQLIVRARWDAAAPRWRRWVERPFRVTLAVNALWTLWIAPNKGANAAFAAANIACCVEMLAYALLACVTEAAEVGDGVEAGHGSDGGYEKHGKREAGGQYDKDGNHVGPPRRAAFAAAWLRALPGHVFGGGQSAVDALNSLTLAAISVLALAYSGPARAAQGVADASFGKDAAALVAEVTAPEQELPVWFWALAAGTALIIWLKALLLLRAGEQTAFFIIELREVAAAVLPFLSVLAVIVLAFASSFNFHSKFMHSARVAAEAERAKAACPSLIDGSKPVDALGEPCAPDQEPLEIPPYLEGFAKSVVFSYLLTLGEFDTDNNEGSAVGWLLFLAASLFSQVVMLNLLVAIFSATHAGVAGRRAVEEVRARAELVREAQALRGLRCCRRCRKQPDDVDEAGEPLRRGRLGKLLLRVSVAPAGPADGDDSAAAAAAEKAEGEAAQARADEALAQQIEAIASSVTALGEEVRGYQRATRESGGEIKRAVVNVAARANAYFRKPAATRIPAQ